MKLKSRVNYEKKKTQGMRNEKKQASKANEKGRLTVKTSPELLTRLKSSRITNRMHK